MSETLTIVSYPRSGRHRMASILSSFANWHVNNLEVTPLVIGLFEDVATEVPGFQFAPWAFAVSAEDTIEKWSKHEGKYLCLMGTHVPHVRIKTRKIAIVRDPRDVAVSYSHWWKKSTKASEEDRLNFLSDWIKMPAAAVSLKWNHANISLYDWENWNKGFGPSDVVLRFSDLCQGKVLEALAAVGVSARIARPPPLFERLRASHPDMYHTGMDHGEKELPEDLIDAAYKRWGPYPAYPPGCFFI